MTYETLASRTGLSPATLKRAACGTTVPKRATVEAYVDGCGSGREGVRAADELWRLARIEERGRLTQLHAPRPELISDEGDLSRALEVVFEQAGAPSLRDIRERSGNPLALPVSSAARIVNRDTVPADQQQLQAFLTGCGVPPELHTVAGGFHQNQQPLPRGTGRRTGRGAERTSPPGRTAASAALDVSEHGKCSAGAARAHHPQRQGTVEALSVTAGAGDGGADHGKRGAELPGSARHPKRQACRGSDLLAARLPAGARRQARGAGAHEHVPSARSAARRRQGGDRAAQTVRREGPRCTAETRYRSTCARVFVRVLSTGRAW